MSGPWGVHEPARSAAPAVESPPRPAQAVVNTDFLGAIRRNRRNTAVLILALLLICAGLGASVGAWLAGADPYGDVAAGGIGGAVVMAAVAGIWSFVALRFGDKIVLRMMGARDASAEEFPQLHNVVEEMALAAGLPKPRVVILETEAMNAFAVGHDQSRAAVGVTRGLLDGLNRDELQGVVAHEMGHVANFDARYATVVAVVVGLIALVADIGLRSFRFGGMRASSSSSGGRGRKGGGGAAVLLVVMLVFMVLAPIAAKLVQMAVSRQREFLADATAVKLTRNPLGLIGALEKLDAQVAAASAEMKPNRATQHLFIVNPLRRFGERATALMSTHPPTEQRIARLRDMRL